ncbi:low molecular weight phosphatase family protein [Mycolicibacterium parafortuitum]|uniref:arsenate reductase/protein-tyrosine-phosphatase family protein n=1 Tax=Mycolicibacterium parafortuitum TaxID=39692 RepID=UPI00234F4223|nr:low molecular weight phosphatase family protein [Mycolicibacterium parafortuitum]
MGGILHILFVCTGNICRSPVAERLSKAYAATRQIPDFVASSAGTRAVIDQAIHPSATRVLEELGGDPAGFRARQLTPKIAASADLIVTMTAAHRDEVLELAPWKLNRTFMLSEASQLSQRWSPRSVDELAPLRSQLGAEERVDVVDPMGQAPEVFRSVGEKIAMLLPPVIDLCGPDKVRA